MEKTNMTYNEIFMANQKFMDAVDTVCLKCICYGEEVCKECSVRKTVDFILSQSTDCNNKKGE